MIAVLDGRQTLPNRASCIGPAWHLADLARPHFLTYDSNDSAREARAGQGVESLTSERKSVDMSPQPRSHLVKKSPLHPWNASEKVCHGIFHGFGQARLEARLRAPTLIVSIFPIYLNRFRAQCFLSCRKTPTQTRF